MSWFTPKKLGVFLALSLTLNVFLIGIMVGARTMHRSDRFDRGHMAGPVISPKGMHRLMRDLPSEKRDQAEAIMAGQRDVIFEHMSEMRDSRRAVRDVLARPDFNRQELDQALAKVRTERAELQAVFHKGLGDMAEILDADSRKKLAERRDWR